MIISQLVVDLADGRTFHDSGSEVAFEEIQRTVIKARIAQNKARVFVSVSNAVH